MDANLACGDNNNTEIIPEKLTDQILPNDNLKIINGEPNGSILCATDKTELEPVDKIKDLNLKERIANCRKIIESLKLELNEEKNKIQEESSEVAVSDIDKTNTYGRYNTSVTSSKYVKDNLTRPDTEYNFSSGVENKLRCDDSLMEYEKQLQKYQDTLTMAQTEKKNAIRKQMLAKAYKLKLLEVENQCNIELLRVKQSMQCLESLQLIANKWKTGDETQTFDLNNYELIPRYPELNPASSNDVNIFTDDEKSEINDNK